MMAFPDASFCINEEHLITKETKLNTRSLTSTKNPTGSKWI